MLSGGCGYSLTRGLMDRYGVLRVNKCNSTTARRNIKDAYYTVCGDISHPLASSPVILSIFPFLNNLGYGPSV